MSLLLVKNWGMAGILLGTVCSQIFNWAGHGFVVYRYGFNNKKRKYVNYVCKNLYYMICFILIVCIGCFLYVRLPVNALHVKLVLGGVACETVAIILYTVLRLV